MKKKDVVFNRKEFLNLDGLNSSANIVTHIVRNRWGNSDYSDCTLNIADCDRVISLDIDLSDEYNRENAMYKIDTLINVLSDYRDAIEEESNRIVKLENKKKAKKKAKKKNGN